MSHKLPAMPFYVGDILKDPGVISLELREFGAWCKMLLLMWECKPRGQLVLGGKKYPDEALAKYLGVDTVLLSHILQTLLDRDVASREEKTGIIYCRRMVNDELIRFARGRAGRKGMKKRWKSKDKDLYQNDNKTITNAYQNTEDESENEDESEIGIKNKNSRVAIASSSRAATKATDVAGFDEFWQAYPKRDGKQEAVKAWLRIAQTGGVGPEFLETVLAAVARQKQNPDWTKEGGRFIPRASTWLNGRRWEDEGVVGITHRDESWKKRYTDAMLPLDDETGAAYGGPAEEQSP